MTTTQPARTALVTGGSSGLGRALVHALDEAGWAVATDARDSARLARALDGTSADALPGDVTEQPHRDELVAWATSHGGLDLLVLNASTLGTLPMRPLAAYAPAELGDVIRTNAGAQAALMTACAHALTQRSGIVLSISSDAAVGHYEGWGPYGASKAALDHLVQTFGAETGLTAYAVDPGDMRTPMHQDAFPGEDISDRPLPESVVPHLLALIDRRPPSGRYVAAEIAASWLGEVAR
jgi:NAD(P)-dependent dehydrogenase (short-subunit alcohol dehydrogenase family)